MAIQEQAQVATPEVQEAEAGSIYEKLCNLVNIEPVKEGVGLSSFSDPKGMADVEPNERLTAALQVFLDVVSERSSPTEKIDKALLDSHIARIDENFQEVESAWRGLKYLVDRCDFKANTKVELLDVSKEDLREDFEEAPDTTQSGLYKHIYVNEYDTPGGEPITAIVANYEFDASAQDIALLTEVSRVFLWQGRCQRDPENP